MEKNFDELKVAIVHDWLTGYAGADRVVDQIKKVFPNAPIYTLVYDKRKFPLHFQQYDIRTTYLQRVPGAVKLYKLMLTLMPKAFESLDLSEYDLVISSTSSCSKGVITKPDTLHICYCNTPTRYIWDFYYRYLENAGLIKRIFMPSLIHKMRIWDRMAADRVDVFIANSKYIANRVWKYYRRNAKVIYPAVHTDNRPFAITEDYYICVGRLTWYKRVDLAVAACTRMGKRLLVIGVGEEEKRLKALAGNTIEFKGYLSDDEIQTYLSKAKALIFAGEEDFGIVPVEAMNAGIPVLAYGRGGAAETVISKKTGLFFYEQSIESLCECINEFEENGVEFSKEELRERSLLFSEERFRNEFYDFCKEQWSLFNDKVNDRCLEF